METMSTLEARSHLLKLTRSLQRKLTRTLNFYTPPGVQKSAASLATSPDAYQYLQLSVVLDIVGRLFSEALKASEEKRPKGDFAEPQVSLRVGVGTRGRP